VTVAKGPLDVVVTGVIPVAVMVHVTVALGDESWV